MSGLRTVEIFLIQVAFYSAVWLLDEYVASYLCIIIPAVAAAVLLISLIVDWIEPAHIGLKYYMVMGISVLVPLLVSVFFYIINDGNIGWLGE